MRAKSQRNKRQRVLFKKKRAEVTSILAETYRFNVSDRILNIFKSQYARKYEVATLLALKGGVWQQRHRTNSIVAD